MFCQLTRKQRFGFVCTLVIAQIAVGCEIAHAAIITVRATDPISVAGRTDFIPAAPGNPPPGYLLTRNIPVGSHSETIPSSIAAAAGDVFNFTVLSGSINYDDIPPNAPFILPADGGFSVNVGSLGGISGYSGPAGALLGVFLDNSVPNTGPAAATINFTALGTNFSSLSPGLRQVFFVGDGHTSAATFQNFVAPVGATRLFLGFADAIGFNGAPGAFDDNAGSYTVQVDVAPAVSTTPEPTSLALWSFAALVAGVFNRRRVGNPIAH